MQNKKVLRIMILALIILWMITVFKLSDQNGEKSSNLSRTVAMMITNNEEKADLIEPYVRKLAHLSEYMVGGSLFSLLFLTYDFSDIKRIIYSFIIGVEYATVDEIHQLFIDGRSGQVQDIFIDSLGILIGICSMMIIYKIIINILQKKKGGVLNK